jgi:hypothetical protein
VWNIDNLILSAGDTMTLPRGISVSISSPDTGVLYRVQGR